MKRFKELLFGVVVGLFWLAIMFVVMIVIAAAKNGFVALFC